MAYVYIAEWCGCILTVSRIMYLPGWFPVAFPVVFVFLGVLLLWQVLPNCRVFPLASLSLASSQLLMQTPCVQLARRCRVTPSLLSRSTLVSL